MVMLVAVLAFASCASPPENRAATDASLREPTVLSGELLYEVIVGEISAQRGNTEESVSALLRAAEMARDHRLAARATQLAVKAGKLEEARAAATIWIELDPDETRANDALIRILLGLGRSEEAIERLEEIIRKAGQEVGPVYRRIAQMLGYPDVGDGLTLYDRLLRHHPNQFEAQLGRADVARRHKAPEVAMLAIEEALKLSPGNERAAKIKMELLIADNDLQGLSAFADLFLTTYPGATAFRLQYGQHLVDLGELARALEHLLRVVDEQPENAEALFTTALVSAELDGYAAAVGYLERFVALQPTSNSDIARLYLAELETKLGHYQRAEKWYHSLTGEKHRLQVQLGLAKILSEQQGVDSAIEFLQGVEPESEDQYEELILAGEALLREAGRLAEAKEMLDRAMDEQPENPRFLYQRGLITATMGRLEEHEQDMRRLIQIEPDNPHAYNALGYTLADKTDRLDEALELISRALELRPDDPFILDSIGWVHFRLGNHEQAINYLQQAFELFPDAEIAAHLGEVNWVSGGRERAREIWGHAYEENPDSSVLKETMQRLDP